MFKMMRIFIMAFALTKQKQGYIGTQRKLSYKNIFYYSKMENFQWGEKLKVFGFLRNNQIIYITFRNIP